MTWIHRTMYCILQRIEIIYLKCINFELASQTNQSSVSRKNHQTHSSDYDLEFSWKSIEIINRSQNVQLQWSNNQINVVVAIAFFASLKFITVFSLVATLCAKTRLQHSNKSDTLEMLIFFGSNWVKEKIIDIVLSFLTEMNRLKWWLVQ